MNEKPSFSMNYYAATLLAKMLEAKRDFFTQSFHSPKFDIQPNEYYVVEVRRVPLPPIEIRLEAALPLPVALREPEKV